MFERFHDYFAVDTVAQPWDLWAALYVDQEWRPLAQDTAGRQELADKQRELKLNGGSIVCARQRVFFTDKNAILAN